ncbi:(deoxy)nucleoside triphosphate pyrophosphohydrolase [Haloechinothrix halophila]|uniref:(deoxy)nucleoside triphosphate pyrophosphohydrolase n=1 Tax=Haloechinothrix halophila TaxID=1069073 RepID=UPI000553099F|nr:(deoxy)nucleoside triphosphate pyrophosphohydrolase [Haloechinothrix halophila]
MAKVVVGAAIVRDGALLAAQRSYPHQLAGFWELPGGQVEPGESEPDALRRECREELDVDVHIGGHVGAADLPGGSVLRIYAASLTDPAAEPVALEHVALRWVARDALDDVDWLPGDRVLLPQLRALLGTTARR